VRGWLAILANPSFETLLGLVHGFKDGEAIKAMYSIINLAMAN
jgi:hypothetical protein